MSTTVRATGGMRRTFRFHVIVVPAVRANHSGRLTPFTKSERAKGNWRRYRNQLGDFFRVHREFSRAFRDTGGIQSDFTFERGANRSTKIVKILISELLGYRADDPSKWPRKGGFDFEIILEGGSKASSFFRGIKEQSDFMKIVSTGG